MEYYAGIDVGGTKVYTAIINQEGFIVGRGKQKIRGETAFEAVLEKMLVSYQLACENADIQPESVSAIGISVPSSVDRVYRVIKHAPNLGWINLKFSDPLQAAFGKPFFVDNDVNMGMFGEYNFGAGKGFRSVYGMFVGTGIGGGYIFDGQIVRGINYTGGEIGHTIIKMGGTRCNCGQRGCLEAYAAKAGMITYMKRLVDKRGQTTLLQKLEPDWRQSLGASALQKAYKKQDVVVMKALKRSANAIGVAAGNIISTAGVEAIVIGGGVVDELSDFYMPRIKKSLAKHTFGNGAEGVALLQSKLGDDAVALGSAWFVRLPEKQDMLFR